MKAQRSGSPNGAHQSERQEQSTKMNHLFDLTDIDWAIVGGESGRYARQIKEEWIDDIHDICRLHGTAFFFKQWGGKNKKRAGRELLGRTWDEMPTV